MEDPAAPNAARVGRWREKLEQYSKRDGPMIVAEAIACILESRKPKLRHVAGRDAKSVLLLRELLPRSVFERLILEDSGLDE